MRRNWHERMSKSSFLIDTRSWCRRKHVAPPARQSDRTLIFKELKTCPISSRSTRHFPVGRQMDIDAAPIVPSNLCTMA